MAAPPDRLRLKVLLGAAVAAGFAWLAVPGGTLDELAFKLVARGFANPPLFVTGFGSRDTPWNLRTFSATAEADVRHAPLIVALGDDPQGIFQSSPPSPVDMAVVFSNFQRLGARKAASAAVLAWDEPDVIGLAALEKTLGKFESLVMAAPVNRGASPQPIPPEFRRASLPVSAVSGDLSLVPQVNRIPLPDVVLGGQFAGFQVIDSESSGSSPFLLARWDDRVIFAFPLMVVLQRLEIPVDMVEIRPGEHLKLGKNGPIVPIDRHGRMVTPAGRTKPFARIAAEALIDGGDDLFPRQAPDPVILLDDRGSAEPATRAFSAGLPSLIAAIASDAGMSKARDYPRPRPLLEFLLLLILCGLCATIASLRGMAGWVCFGLAAAMLIAAQFLGFSAGWWLPGPVGFVTLAAAVLLSYWLERMAISGRTAIFTLEPSTSVDLAETATPASVVVALPDGNEARRSDEPDDTLVTAPAKKKPRAPRRKSPAAETTPSPAKTEKPKPKRTRTSKSESTGDTSAKPTSKRARKSGSRKKPDSGS